MTAATQKAVAVEDLIAREHRWDRCVLRCALLGRENCSRCPIPGPRGEMLCPGCGERLFFVNISEGRGRWGCSNLTGCGLTISFPTTDPKTEAAATAELAEYRREKARIRQAKSRARQRVRHQAEIRG